MGNFADLISPSLAGHSAAVAELATVAARSFPIDKVDFAASSKVEDNVDHPLGPTLYMFSVLHCMTVSLAEDGAGLGTLWGEQKALEMLDEAGFGVVDVRRIDGDPFNNYYVARRAE